MYEKKLSTKDLNRLLFIQMLNIFPNLKYLNFDINLYSCHQLSFRMLPLGVVSSTLLELHVSLDDFDDCLYLLDGRFNQLHTLHVDVGFISTLILTIDNKVN
jgi:hypothetical protein